MLKRLFLALAAVAAVLVLALVLPALFGGDHDLPPLPRLVSAAGPGSQPMPQGLLAGADLTLITDLPEAPAEVPVYRIATTPFPATSEEALAWARDFGLPDPKVYCDPREPEAIFVLGDDGQQLTFRQFGPMGSIDYGNERAAAATEGTPLFFDQAADIAVAFLRKHDLLPAAYRVQESEHFAPRPENPIRFVHVVPELGGHPLAGYRSGAQVAVNPAGQVTYASFNPLTFEQDGNYPIKSAQEAYDELSGGQVAGSPFRLDTDVRYSAEMDVQHYSPPPPAWSTGQPVTLTGWVHVLVAEDGSDVRAELMARGGTQYDLTGPRLAELADVGFDDVQIKGTVVAQVGEHHWQVEVADWETIPQRQPHCLVGTFTLDEDGAWLATDGGERYRLPNAPDELSDGQRIEVCADERPADGGDVDWWSIVSPPMSEGEGYVGSSSSSVVVVVEAPVEEPFPATPTPVGAAKALAITPTPVAPPPQAETVFEIGQSVEVTGVVEVGPSVVNEATMIGPGGLQGAFVVDRVELAYYYEPQPGYVARSTDGPPLTQEPAEMIIQPAWVFYGHNADDTVRFTAYVQAVVEEHVQNATP